MADVEEKNDRNRSASENSETEADPQFEPVINLPEVKVMTNEEDEEVVLQLRAKLYRFDTSNEDVPEWKERGTGEVKLLHHKGNNTIRVVMRRDKTLKVCANHFITPWMELKPCISSEKAFVYNVPADFADEQIKSECLAIRFGSVEFAKQFKEKFNESRETVIKTCKLYNGDDEDRESDDEDSESEDENVKTENSLNLTVEKLSELNVCKTDGGD